jgi:hypothetical protein
VYSDWIHMVQDRLKWPTFANTVMNLRASILFHKRWAVSFVTEQRLVSQGFSAPWSELITDLRDTVERTLINVTVKALADCLNLFFLFTGSTAPLGPGLRFFSFMTILQTVGLLGRVISSSQGLYLNTEWTHILVHTKHPSLVWDSNPRSLIPSKRRQYMP